MKRAVRITLIIILLVSIFYLYGGQAHHRFEYGKVSFEIEQFRQENKFLDNILIEKKDSMKDIRLKVEFLEESLKNCK